MGKGQPSAKKEKNLRRVRGKAKKVFVSRLPPGIQHDYLETRRRVDRLEPRSEAVGGTT